ncbi:MAG: hypothetical protein ACREB0_11405, partial [Sphingopyxis sp.]
MKLTVETAAVAGRGRADPDIPRAVDPHSFGGTGIQRHEIAADPYPVPAGARARDVEQARKPGIRVKIKRLPTRNAETRDIA